MTTFDSKGNIEHVKGDTFTLNLTDVKLDAVAFDWTGYSAELRVKTSAASTTNEAELTSDSEIDLSVNGAMTIVDDIKINDLTAGRTYYYDLVVIGETTDTWLNNKKLKILT